MDKTAIATKQFDCVIKNWPEPNVYITGVEVLEENFIFRTSSGVFLLK